MLQITKYLQDFHNNKYTRVMFILLIKRLTTGFLTIEYVEISKKILHVIIIISPSNNTVAKILETITDYYVNRKTSIYPR